MPLAVFNPSQPWGDAEKHQREHPEQWTPELIETTASWTVIVRSIVQSQQEIMANPKVSPTFVRRCAEDPAMRAHLDLVVDRNMYGLLKAWFIEGVRERLFNHAVPRFWRHYRELPALAPGVRSSAAVQRRIQAAFFAAMHELSAYVGAQLTMVSVLEEYGWRSMAPGGAPPARVAVGAVPPRKIMFNEVLETLHALVLSRAPTQAALSWWLTVCWHRSVIDMREPPPPSSRSAHPSAPEGEEEEGEEVGEEEVVAWDADERAEGEDEDEDENMGVDAAAAAEALRACSAQLHQLRWLPIVEPTLSTVLHGRLHAALLRTCAKRFDTPYLQRILSWVHSSVARWLRAVLMPNAPPSAPDSPEMSRWIARLQVRGRLRRVASDGPFDAPRKAPDCRGWSPLTLCRWLAAAVLPSTGARLAAHRRALRSDRRLPRLDARDPRPKGVSEPHPAARGRGEGPLHGNRRATAPSRRRHGQHHPSVRVNDPRRRLQA